MLNNILIMGFFCIFIICLTVATSFKHNAMQKCYEAATVNTNIVCEKE